METTTQIIISLTAYKIASLLAGCFFSYMGYKLFTAGIHGHAGELESQFGNNKLILKKAAPGTFFTIFGAIIISITLMQKLDYQYQESGKQNKIEIKKENENELPKELPF